MAGVELVIAVLLVSCATAQMPVPGFFNIPGSAFNRGGRVDFAGLSLGQICKQIMLMGGKEALSDGMGMAAKWLSNQRISSQIAGGADPQMQCLYNQATGGMMPGAMGTRDPGNMFGDYYDTVIEYPMILDPCTAPQCDGNVNPTVLLMQTFAPMMRMGGMGAGMGGMGTGFGGTGGAAPAVNTNPFSAMAQNPFLAALMPKTNSAPAATATAGNATQTPAPTGQATPNAATSTSPAQVHPMFSMLQNPQMMQMMQQILMNMLMKNQAQAGAGPASGAAGFPGFPSFGNGFQLPGSMFV